MIRSFKCRDTEALFHDLRRAKFRLIENIARRKLAMLDAAVHLIDLKSPPGNRLESLKGNRKGQHSIRINDKYRLCFVWKNGEAHDVEIVDYHRG